MEEDSDFPPGRRLRSHPAGVFGGVRPPFANIAAKLQNCMHSDFQPMALGSLKSPFSHPDWLFELQYDGFRALAHIDGKRTQLVSRNGHPFASFSDLGDAIATALPSFAGSDPAK